MKKLLKILLLILVGCIAYSISYAQVVEYNEYGMPIIRRGMVSESPSWINDTAKNDQMLIQARDEILSGNGLSQESIEYGIRYYELAEAYITTFHIDYRGFYTQDRFELPIGSPVLQLRDQHRYLYCLNLFERQYPKRLEISNCDGAPPFESKDKDGKRIFCVKDCKGVTRCTEPISEKDEVCRTIVIQAPDEICRLDMPDGISGVFRDTTVLVDQISGDCEVTIYKDVNMIELKEVNETSFEGDSLYIDALGVDTLLTPDTYTFIDTANCETEVYKILENPEVEKGPCEDCDEEYRDKGDFGVSLYGLYGTTPAVIGDGRLVDATGFKYGVELQFLKDVWQDKISCLVPEVGITARLEFNEYLMSQYRGCCLTFNGTSGTTLQIEPMIRTTLTRFCDKNLFPYVGASVMLNYNNNGFDDLQNLNIQPKIFGGVDWFVLDDVYIGIFANAISSRFTSTEQVKLYPNIGLKIGYRFDFESESNETK